MESHKRPQTELTFLLFRQDSTDYASIAPTDDNSSAPTIVIAVNQSRVPTTSYLSSHLSFFDSPTFFSIAVSASEAMTWPYSFTRLGSTRYIQRCTTSPSFVHEEIRQRAYLVEEDEEDNVVPETCKTVKDGHLDDKAASARS